MDIFCVLMMETGDEEARGEDVAGVVGEVNIVKEV